jgi:hypothetical protein
VTLGRHVQRNGQGGFGRRVLCPRLQLGQNDLLPLCQVDQGRHHLRIFAGR